MVSLSQDHICFSGNPDVLMARCPIRDLKEKKSSKRDWAWWYTLENPVLQEAKQEDPEFENSLGLTVRA